MKGVIYQGWKSERKEKQRGKKKWKRECGWKRKIARERERIKGKICEGKIKEREKEKTRKKDREWGRNLAIMLRKCFGKERPSLIAIIYFPSSSAISTRKGFYSIGIRKGFLDTKSMKNLIQLWTVIRGWLNQYFSFAIILWCTLNTFRKL